MTLGVDIANILWGCARYLHFPLLILFIFTLFIPSWLIKRLSIKPKEPNKMPPTLRPAENPGTANPGTPNPGTAQFYPLNFCSKMSLHSVKENQ